MKWLYPPWYQQKVDRWRRGEIDWDGNALRSDDPSLRESFDKLNSTQIRRLVVFLRLDSLPSLFTFMSLLGGDSAASASKTEQTTVLPGDAYESANRSARKRHLEVHGLRLLELTERTSSVMQVTEGEEYSQRDPVVNAFRTFAQLNDVAVSGRVEVVPTDYYADTLMTQASDVSSDFVLVPWSEYGSVTEDQSVPFAVSSVDRFQGRAHLEFMQKALQRGLRTCNTGVFINRGFGGMAREEAPPLRRNISSLSVRSHPRDATTTLPVTDKSHYIFFPFFGGVDDRVALRFVLQLAKNPNVTATIAHFSWPAEEEATSPEVAAEGSSRGLGRPQLSPMTSRTAPPKATEEASKVDENFSPQDLGLLSTLRSSLPAELVGRVQFTEVGVTSETALDETLRCAREAVGKAPKNSGDIVVVGRRHGRFGDRPAEGGGADLKRTIGAVAEQMVVADVKASVLVVQAGGRGLDM